MKVNGYIYNAVWGLGKSWEYYSAFAKDNGVKYLIDQDFSKVKQGNEKEDGFIYLSPDEIGNYPVSGVFISLLNRGDCREIEGYLDSISMNHLYINEYIEKVILSEVDQHIDFESICKEPISKIIITQIPTWVCNFRCSYCYLIQRNENSLKEEYERYSHIPEFIASALSYYRMNGRCYIDLASFGETLLYGDLKKLTELLLENGHIVSITTNGTISRVIDQLLEIDDRLLSNLFIRFSFHYIELKKRNLIGIYFENIRKIKESKASFTVMMVASDIYAPYKSEIMKVCVENIGALPQIDFVRESTGNDYGLMSKKNLADYIQFWSEFKSKKFEHRIHFFNRKISGYCHAGKSCMYVNLFTGDLAPCSQMNPISNIYENIKEKVRYDEVGYRCNCNWCINSVIWSNFGAIEDEYRGHGFAETFNRVDNSGESWIKPNLYKTLNGVVSNK